MHSMQSATRSKKLGTNYNMTINHPQFRGRAESRDLLFRCVNFIVQQEIKKNYFLFYNSCKGTVTKIEAPRSWVLCTSEHVI